MPHEAKMRDIWLDLLQYLHSKGAHLKLVGSLDFFEVTLDQCGVGKAAL